MWLITPTFIVRHVYNIILKGLQGIDRLTRKRDNNNVGIDWLLLVLDFLGLIINCTDGQRSIANNNWILDKLNYF